MGESGRERERERERERKRESKQQMNAASGINSLPHEQLSARR